MPDIIAVSDREDKRLRLYGDVKDRDLTGREGLFMAEGKVVLERLFRSRFAQTVSVLTSVERLKSLDLNSLPHDVPVYVAPQSLMDTVAGFPIHRGYLALGRCVVPSLDGVLTKVGRLRVLALSEISNVDNMGGLIRNAAAFGVDAVLIDEACCDPLYRKAIRVSVGGVFEVPHFRVASLTDALRVFNITPYALSPSGALRLDDITPAERSAFLFGAEGPGLAKELMAACTTVRIDMHGGFDSLNVATTSGIVLYKVCT